MGLMRPLRRMVERFNAFFGGGLVFTIAMVVTLGACASLAFFLYFNSAPPNHLTISGGPEGSSFRRNAEKYQAILAKQGVRLNILASEGSVNNLARLADPNVPVDVGFVLGGEAEGIDTSNLMSLGSIAYQPLMIFFRGDGYRLLSDFKGKRVDIGPEGSGTHSLASALLKANGIDPAHGDVTLVESPAEGALAALTDQRMDAFFVMGDSASSDVIRALLRAPAIHLFEFTQAEAYSRRFNYLNRLTLPEGAVEFGENIPAQDIHLVGPTVELVARRSLHPALSDLLLEAAREVHSPASVFRKRGEFPAPQEHELPISADAVRYYASGKSFLYRTFPFWIASLIARFLAVIVPVALLIIPGLKIAPAIYRWRIESRVYRWYRELLDLEREALRPRMDATTREGLLRRLDRMEETVRRIVVPAAFGDLFYGLRGHISFVRETLQAEYAGAAGGEGATSALAPEAPAGTGGGWRRAQ